MGKQGGLNLQAGEFEYTSELRLVVRNKKNGSIALFDGLGNGGSIHVTPIRRDGRFSKTKPHWTRESAWVCVGAVKRNIALRKEIKKPGLLGRIFGGSEKEILVPNHEWLEDLQIISEEHWAPILLRYDFAKLHFNSDQAG